jgi:hypothetical protein
MKEKRMCTIIIMVGTKYYTVNIQELRTDVKNLRRRTEPSFVKASGSISSPPLPYVFVGSEIFGLSTKL